MSHEDERTLRIEDVEVMEEVEDVVSSVPQTSRNPAMEPAPQRVKAAAATPCRRGSERPSRAPSQAASVGPLEAARELLRNPPGAMASPDAQQQWRNDVDRLLHLAQATPSSARAGSRPPPGSMVAHRHHQCQGGASASVHSPTVRGARTEDLRAELSRRRAGEDARVSIDRARNR